MTRSTQAARRRAETAPDRPCIVCWSEPARRGRRDGRGPVCAAYWHRYHRDRTEELIVRNNIRRFERTCLQ